MKVLSFILGVLYLAGGVVLSFLLLIAQLTGRYDQSFFLWLLFLLTTGCLPIWCAVTLLRARHGWQGILSCLLIQIGAALSVGTIMAGFDESAAQPLWLIVVSAAVLGLFPTATGIWLLRKRPPFPKVAGVGLLGLGVMMAYGFVIARNENSSRMWLPDLAALTIACALPSLLGVLIFRGKLEELQKAVKWATVGSASVFIACSAAFFLFPPQISDPLSFPAATSLVIGTAAGIIWATIQLKSRTKRRRLRHHEPLPPRPARSIVIAPRPDQQD